MRLLFSTMQVEMASWLNSFTDSRATVAAAVVAVAAVAVQHEKNLLPNPTRSTRNILAILNTVQRRP